VTRHGCRRGESFEGRRRLGEGESRADRSPVRLFGDGWCAGRSGSSRETRRTPRSAAGRNRPARCRAEKTVGAGRNGMGGTSPERGNSGPKVADREPSSFETTAHDRSLMLLLGACGSANHDLERTLGADVDGGAIFGQPQERNPDPAGSSRISRKGRSARTDGEGTRELERVSEGEVKVRRARLPVDPTPWRTSSGSPPQASEDAHPVFAKAKEGTRGRPTTRNPL